MSGYKGDNAVRDYLTQWIKYWKEDAGHLVYPIAMARDIELSKIYTIKSIRAQISKWNKPDYTPTKYQQELLDFHAVATATQEAMCANKAYDGINEKGAIFLLKARHNYIEKNAVDVEMVEPKKTLPSFADREDID